VFRANWATGPLPSMGTDALGEVVQLSTTGNFDDSHRLEFDPATRSYVYLDYATARATDSFRFVSVADVATLDAGAFAGREAFLVEINTNILLAPEQRGDLGYAFALLDRTRSVLTVLSPKRADSVRNAAARHFCSGRTWDDSCVAALFRANGPLAGLTEQGQVAEQRGWRSLSMFLDSLLKSAPNDPNEAWAQFDLSEYQLRHLPGGRANAPGLTRTREAEVECGGLPKRKWIVNAEAEGPTAEDLCYAEQMRLDHASREWLAQLGAAIESNRMRGTSPSLALFARLKLRGPGVTTLQQFKKLGCVCGKEETYECAFEANYKMLEVPGFKPELTDIEQLVFPEGPPKRRVTRATRLNRVTQTWEFVSRGLTSEQAGPPIRERERPADANELALLTELEGRLQLASGADRDRLLARGFGDLYELANRTPGRIDDAMTYLYFALMFEVNTSLERVEEIFKRMALVSGGAITLELVPLEAFDEQTIRSLSRMAEAAERLGLTDTVLSFLPALILSLDAHRGGRYIEARRTMDQLHTFLGRKPSDEGVDLLVTIALAEMERESGNLARAWLLEQQAMHLTELEHGKMSLAYAGRLNSLSHWFLASGQQANAADAIDKALTVIDQLDSTGSNTSVLAPAPANAGDLMRSILLRDRAGLASVSPEEAITLLTRAESLMVGALGSEHPAVRRLQIRQSTLQIRTGNVAGAVASLRDVLRKTEGSVGVHPVTAEAMVELGFALGMVGRWEEASSQFRRAAFVRNQLADTLGAAEAEYGMSMAYAAMNDSALAIFWNKVAIDNVEQSRWRADGLDGSAKASWFARSRHIYQDLIALLIAADRLADAQSVGDLLKDFETETGTFRSGPSKRQSGGLVWSNSESAGKKLYEEAAAAARAPLAETGQRQLRNGLGGRTERRFVESLTKVQTDGPLAAPGPVSQPAAKDAPPSSSFPLPSSRLVAAIEALGITPGRASVIGLQYFVSEKQSWLVLVAPKSRPVVVPLGLGRAEVRRLVDGWELLTHLGDYGQFSRPGAEQTSKRLKELHRLLVAPVELELARIRPGTIFLQLDDALRHLPFAAFQAADGRYFVQDYGLMNFNAAVDSSDSKGSRGFKMAALGLTRAVPPLPALRQTRSEISQILSTAPIFGDSYFDDAFDERRLFSVIRGAAESRYRLLHLATHFEFSTKLPHESALVLGDGNRLTLGEWNKANMRLDPFDLVGLSACQTAIGPGATLDGAAIESLGGHMQRSGAGAVLATIWRVDDESTAAFMKEFYRRMAAEGATKADALRAVQLDLIEGRIRRSAAQLWSDPFYWAPFILMSNSP
jgi:CHAT domain-containing protein/tetratricopeptide (TPR) repeat protein